MRTKREAGGFPLKLRLGGIMIYRNDRSRCAPGVGDRYPVLHPLRRIDGPRRMADPDTKRELRVGTSVFEG